MLDGVLIWPLVITSVGLIIIGICIFCCCFSRKRTRASTTPEPQSGPSTSYDDTTLHEPTSASFATSSDFNMEDLPPSYSEVVRIRSSIRHRNSKDTLALDNVTYEKRLDVDSPDGSENTSV